MYSGGGETFRRAKSKLTFASDKLFSLVPERSELVIFDIDILDQGYLRYGYRLERNSREDERNLSSRHLLFYI